MSRPAVLEISLDPKLHSALIAAAKVANRSVADIVSDLVQDFVALEPEAPGYDDFLREKIEIARVSARAGRGRSNDDVEAFFSALRKELLTQSQ